MVEVYSSDTIAFIQRGIFQQPGYYGNQENTASNQGFNSAVGIASAAVGFASLLKKQAPPPPTYVRSKTNYILTTLEKQAIYNRSQQLAAYGVVPYDVLENFFYVLAATENHSDLIFISNVVGIPQLAEKRYIRNVRGICEIDDIYKIGYLANGLASVNQRYAPQYSGAEYYTDANQSSYGNINNALNLSTELGVLGPIILSAATNLAGSGTYLAAAPNLSSASIIGAVNGVGSLYGNSGVSLSPTTIGAILNPTATIANQVTSAGLSAVSNLLNATPLGGALAAFGPLGGIAGAAVLSQIGGNAVGSFMSQVLTGTRIASSQIANNPMLTPPSYAGKSFFGEAPVALPAIDQVFCRSIGAFSASSGGNGVVSFGMQNFASMGSAMSVASLVSNMLTGSFSIPSPTTFFGNQVAQNITNVCNVLNVKATSNIEPRRSDNTIPFMIGMSAAIAGETFTPFGSTPFTTGWKLASSTANDIQKYNPQYLETCRTSL